MILAINKLEENAKVCEHIKQYGRTFPVRCPLPGPPSPVSLQQRLKRWEDLLDNQAIALSRRMNAVGLIERGRACHTIEKKWNPRQAGIGQLGWIMVRRDR